MASQDDQEANRKSGLAYGAALNLFACVVALTGVGWGAVDRWLGTAPWLLVDRNRVGSSGWVLSVRPHNFKAQLSVRRGCAEIQRRGDRETGRRGKGRRGEGET